MASTAQLQQLTVLFCKKLSITHSGLRLPQPSRDFVLQNHNTPGRSPPSLPTKRYPTPGSLVSWQDNYIPTSGLK